MILWTGSQNENIFSYLPLGCQMVCIGIRGETGALKVAEQCEYVAVKEPDNWQLRGIQGTVSHLSKGPICLSRVVDETRSKDSRI